MPRIGMTLSHDRIDAPLADHFGKAKWLLAYEGPERFEFCRNQGLNGGYVSQVLEKAGCTDAIVTHAGPGAISHLRAAGIRIWQGEPGVPAKELADRLERGTLPEFKESEGGAQGHSGGCGCSH